MAPAERSFLVRAVGDLEAQSVAELLADDVFDIASKRASLRRNVVLIELLSKRVSKYGGHLGRWSMKVR